MRVLVVEDDEMVGSGITKWLSKEGHTVDWLQDGLSAKQALQTETFDIIVLDIGLPKMDGLDLLHSIRSKGITIPVLLLTARDTIEDRVQGLDSGADDYITKPYELEELSARLRALYRRFSLRTEPKLDYKNIQLDPAGHTVKFKGEEMTLSRREFALLHTLLANVGRVLSREHLTQTLYGWGDDVDSNALEVHIHNLRKKFGTGFIRTVRGVGYMVEKELGEWAKEEASKNNQ
ncbi:MAG: response regulator [Gammaproteobacteria bacterium]